LPVTPRNRTRGKGYRRSEEGFEQKVAKEAKGIGVVRQVAPDSGKSFLAGHPANRTKGKGYRRLEEGFEQKVAKEAKGIGVVGQVAPDFAKIPF
jgi:hypothetical protein